MPELENTSYVSVAPDLAVEVVSPSDSQRLITIKVANYLAEGTVVWVVYPEEQSIDVYTPNSPVVKLTLDNVLDGGDLLPDFTLALKTAFKSNWFDELAITMSVRAGNC